MSASRLRRNAVLVVPVVVFIAYVSIYLLAFPRCVSSDPDSSVITPPTWRICTHRWQKAVWLPVSWIELRCRGGERAFLFLCVEEMSGSYTTDSIVEGLGLKRVWP